MVKVKAKRTMSVLASLVYCTKFLHESHFWELNLIN